MDAMRVKPGLRQASVDFVRARPVIAAALAVIVIGGAAIAGAWYFQYVLKYQPCALCLEQRTAYYLSIPLAVLLLAGETTGASRKVLLAGLLVIAAGFLWNAGLGAYHAGIEWGWWRGPAECS